MKIAVLGWGSLIWKRGNLAVAGDFIPAGPRVPIEYCRVSTDGRRKAAEPFTVKAAVRYLERLDKQSFACAIEYIRKAPRDAHAGAYCGERPLARVIKWCG